MDERPLSLDYGATDVMRIVASVIAVALTILLLATWVSQRKGSKALRLPPGPRGWPVLGSLPSLGALPHQSLQKLATKYGPLMYMRLGCRPTVVISNAEMAKEVYKTNDRIMASRANFLLPAYVYYGRQNIGFAPYGPIWRELRKICTLELLTAARLCQFQGTREREILFMVQSIVETSRKGNVVRINHFLGNLTMNVITQMMWNKRHGGIKESDDDETTDRLPDLIRDLENVLGANNIADYLPAAFQPIIMKLAGTEKKMKSIHESFDIFLEDIIRQHRDAQHELAAGEVDDAPSDADDFVDVLLKLSKSEQHLTPDRIKAVLLDMLTAGTDTSATTMEWGLAEMVRHPDLMKKAQDELDDVVGQDRLVKESDIPNLKYLGAIVKETFRLHSVVPLAVPHESVEDCEITNYHIAAKSLVFVNLYAIHRDPTVYESPEKFDPDRFVKSRVDFKGQDFELLPFGSGRRMCPAMNLGALVVHFALAQLLHAFTWTPADNKKPEEVDIKESFGLVCPMATPLQVNAKPRLRPDVLFLDKVGTP